MKYIRYYFILLAVMAMGYFILGELFLPKDSPNTGYLCQELNDEWQVVHEDGTKSDIEIPGSFQGAVVIERKLPENMDKGISCICFRGSAIKIYVDDELRLDYNTEHTRLFGNHSAEAYVMAGIDITDAGKTIRAEMENDSNIMYSVYIGDRMGVWKFLFMHYGSELLIAFLTLILGLISVIASLALRIMYKKSIDLEYLGWGVTFAAVWLITNSVFRQVMFPSVSVISDVPFLMIALMPFPFMIYMNRVQKSRYEKIYVCASILDVIGNVICIGLHVTNTMDFNKSFLVLAICCLQSILGLAITVILDWKKGNVKEYWMVAAGLLSAFVAATYQIISYFQRTGVFSGVPLAAGLIVLLVFAVVDTLKNIISLENQKHEAVMASEAKGQFLANMSHEIRTPINAVLGMNSMVLRESTESNIREYAMDIQAAGQNLLSLINDILDFSKIEAGKMELVLVDYDFSSVIHDIMNMIRTKVETKDLYLDLHIDRNLPARMYGDDVRIRQILINILNNAVKYTEKGGVIFSITGEVENDEAILHFSVKDTGIGIKEEDLEKLFSAFERIEEKRNRNVEGTGLGMNITIQLLELMGSKLNVKSVYGKGSVFSFDLRQKITDPEPIGNLEKRIREQAQDFQYEVIFTAPTANVLVVDDNAVNRKVFIHLLKETKINIDEASSGVQCLGLVGIKKYDIIFLDHMMPEMDGIETLHKIKELDQNLCTDTPIIALTANAISGARDMYLSEGFDDFLTKPIVPEKLEGMIMKHLPNEKVMKTKVEKHAVNNLYDGEYNQKDLQKQHIEAIISKLEEHPEFNLSYAKTFNQKPGDLIEVFQDFYEMMDDEVSQLQEFYQNLMGYNENFVDTTKDDEITKALQQYRVKVHSMKSSAAMIGAMGLSGMALSLEKAASTGEIGVINTVSPVFVTEWNQYKGILEECLLVEKEKDLVEEADIISDGDLVSEEDLISDEDLVSEEDLISEEDLVSGEDLISEEDLVSEEDLISEEDLVSEEDLISEE
ncbi:MAG: response regulator, partial [Lachnospiraceae bacterium]